MNYKKYRLAILLVVLLQTSAYAQMQTEVNQNGFNVTGDVLDDYALYNIGGGRAVSMTNNGHMQSITVGVGWNANLICGDMSISTTIKNQLNGATNGFKNIMSNVISNATSAVASLPALIIQRANPALYNLLTNGVLQGRLDFDRSKMTCRAIADKMADYSGVGGQTGWSQLSEGMALKNAVGSSGGSADAVATIEQAEKDKGNNGVPWIGGANAGGKSQTSIKVVSDITKAGYNLLNNKSATSTASIPSSSCNNNLTCLTWRSPAEAATFANRVLGERELRTCNDCTKTQTTPGVGLTALIQEEFEVKLKALQELVNGSKLTTVTNLEAAGSNSLPITRGVVEALRNEPDLNIMVSRLASEVALASVMEKALLLQRTLLTGAKEPNVSANELAQQAVDKEMNILSQEINNLKTELDIRQQLSKNSAVTILERYRIRSENSRSIYQGDPNQNRFDLINKDQSGQQQ